MLQKNTSTAFNLAELIVVITILAILGTIGFISLQGYAQSARESSRISDMRTIEKALLLHQTQYETLPLPDNALTLTVSGSIVAYQGDLGPQTLTAIRQAGEVRDPLDDTLYTYTLHSNRRDFQLLGFMERPSSLTYKTSPLNLVSSRRWGFQTYANEYTDRYPKSTGQNIGSILQTPKEGYTPLHLIETGTYELTTTPDTTSYILHYSDTESIELTWYALWGIYAARTERTVPENCPTGFIPVPGNPEFNTTGWFCVAQYEMTYTDADTPNSTRGGTDWNTVAHVPGKQIISQAWKYPIADIHQQEAIDACKSMGEGYHLITNDQWMTIARNIEATAGGATLYNGVSSDITLGCDATGGNTELRSYATKTGPGDQSCNTKRSHSLSNGQMIWDLSGNVWEHVNKGNTTTGIGFNDGQTTVAWSTSAIIWDNDGIYDATYMQLYGSALWHGTAEGKWNLLYAGGVANNIFLRGGNASSSSDTGVFTLALLLAAGNNANRAVGFRCVK